MKMSVINIKKDIDMDITLCKVNKEPICKIPYSCLSDITRSIDNHDVIRLNIYKYISSNDNMRMLNPIYEHIKEQRYLNINNEEIFVIEDVYVDDSTDTPYKEVVCYSRDRKLTRIDVEFEDLGIVLEGSGDGIYTFNLFDYLKSETGWNKGYVDPNVSMNGDEPHMRWQQSISTTWYGFLMNEVSESFGCIVTFDTMTKSVNIHSIDSVGENINLYLCHDNYVRGLKRESSTSGLVTRLKLIGSEEMDIIGAVVTGSPYLEDFSYFIESGEMSVELIAALDKYYSMTKDRQEQWNILMNSKIEKENLLLDKKNTLYTIYEEINVLKKMKEIYANNGDLENENTVWLELSKKEDDKVILEVEIRELELEVESLKDSILEINILCRKPTSTDENGKLIFNDDLLDELTDFIFYDTYSNDSFLNVEDLVAAGERMLSLKCKPTITYTIDSVNFMDRILDIGYRKQFSGDIGLGDIIILYDRDKQEEVYQFLVGYSFSPGSHVINLNISNKKLNKDDTREIADYLKQAKETARSFNAKKHLLIKQKYNRINL